MSQGSTWLAVGSYVGNKRGSGYTSSKYSIIAKDSLKALGFNMFGQNEWKVSSDGDSGDIRGIIAYVLPSARTNEGIS